MKNHTRLHLKSTEGEGSFSTGTLLGEKDIGGKTLSGRMTDNSVQSGGGGTS